MAHLSTRHAGLACPHCGNELDAAMHITGKRGPRAGDLAFCVDCGQWSFYTLERGRLGQRKPSDDELMALHLNQNVHRIERAWLELKARPGAHKSNR
jgi:hypothetical protein